jgi:hypothetical protein
VLRVRVVGLVVLLLASIWVAISVIGGNGNPVVCPNDEPLSADFEASGEQPSMATARAAQRDLPEGQRAVFNEYTGEFEGVDAVTEAGTYGKVAVAEPLVYTCKSNEPTLAPLSEVDPQAAREAHRRMSRLIPDRIESNGLGDPAGATRRSSGL